MNDYLKLALTELPQYFMSLLELLVSPKAFLISRCSADEDNSNRATIFIGMTLLFSFLMQIPLLPKQVNITNQFALLIANELVLMATTLLAIRLAWKFVGGKATLRQLFVCTAYAAGPMFYIFISCNLVGDAFFQVIDPEGHSLVLNHPFSALPESSLKKNGIVAEIGGFISGLIGAYVWLIIVQGAYRSLNQVSRARSFAAFIMTQVFQIPLIIFAVTLDIEQISSW